MRARATRRSVAKAAGTRPRPAVVADAKAGRCRSRCKRPAGQRRDARPRRRPPVGRSTSTRCGQRSPPRPAPADHDAHRHPLRLQPAAAGRSPPSAGLRSRVANAEPAPTRRPRPSRRCRPRAAKVEARAPRPPRAESPRPKAPPSPRRRSAARPRDLDRWVIQLGASTTRRRPSRSSAGANPIRPRLARASPFTEKVVARRHDPVPRPVLRLPRGRQAQDACRTLKRSGFTCFATRS